MENLEKKVLEEIENLKESCISEFVDILKIPAISPEYGGEGEYKKAAKILQILKQSYKFDSIKVISAKDKYKKQRPNILAFYNGKTKNKFWIIAHMDVVPIGNEKEWKSKPFEPVIKDGKIFARGALDNGQAIAATLLAIKAIMKLGIKPKTTIAIAFLSDEETGSNYGLKFLIKKHRQLFSKKDFALVPDAGNEEGTMIEMAEKSILWLKIKIKGKEAHASTPENGINAHRIGMQYALELDELLHKKYKLTQKPFSSTSTFEPTMVENSASSPNILPGEHEIVFDCRILPKYKIEEVLKDAKNLAKKFEKRVKGLRIEFEEISSEKASKPTSEKSKIVKELKKAIKELRGKNAFVKGIGGGTFARYLREIGIPSAVWLTGCDVEHQPNEYCRINDIVEDAKVIALLMLRI